MGNRKKENIEGLDSSHVACRNNGFFFLWEKIFPLIQNISIVPAMQHGCLAKPPMYHKVNCVCFRDTVDLFRNFWLPSALFSRILYKNVSNSSVTLT